MTIKYYSTAFIDYVLQSASYPKKDWRAGVLTMTKTLGLGLGLLKRTDPGVCVQGITDHQNMRDNKLELYGSPVTLLMLR